MNIYVVCFLLLGIVGFAHGSGCSCTWIAHGSRCYKVLPDKRNQAAQAAECRKMGGYLAEPKSTAQNAFIRHMIQETGVGTSFIGFNDKKLEGIFVGISRVPVGYTRWAAREPNNYIKWRKDEDCSEMYPNGLWNDIFCHFKKPAVCERRTCKAGFRRYNDRCYKAFTQTTTYHHAKKICRHFRGHLATPQTVEENNFIKSLIKGSSYIEFNGLVQKLAFTTNNAVCLRIYNNWAPREPNNAGGKEHCVEMYRDGRWNDLPCHFRRGFVCQN